MLGAASWKHQRLWEQPLRGPRGSGLILQRLWEQLPRGSRGCGSGHLDAPEALGAAISTRHSLHLEAAEASGAAIARLQRLWEQPSRGSRGSRSPTGSDLSFLEFSRVFSSLETSWGALPTAPSSSRRPAGGLEPAQEGFPVASSCLKSAPKWLRDE